MQTNTNSAAEFIFTMGLPGAGKSTVVVSKHESTHVVIDSDKIMASHPEYNPNDPNALYEWAAAEAEALFMRSVAARAGKYLVDSTGTNSERMVRQMTQARAMGFTVRLIYVQCSLATSIKRNANRARKVPEWVIRQKAMDIATSFEIVAPHADSIEIVQNDG
ncbi:ATP-binding protein [Candidatus Dependentiae bacterium]|nr:MAG: ATP-binding protein [Candidatus Dependentiae bacterium]